MIIGFVGFLGSGKGTAGDFLAEYGFIRESFARPVKDIASMMFGWDRNMLEGNTEKSRKFRETPDTYWSNKFGRKFTPREALQKIGTEAVRDLFHENFWIQHLENRIDPTKNYVITDVRFPNEINWLREDFGGKIFEVQNKPNPEWYSHLVHLKAKCADQEAVEFMADKGVHPSEWKWIGEPCDGLITNFGTIPDFLLELRAVLVGPLLSVPELKDVAELPNKMLALFSNNLYNY